jgi:uncharacterized protein with HEPN domain
LTITALGGAGTLGLRHLRTHGDLEHDELLHLALTKLVEVVGEAAKHVSDGTRLDYPDV